MIKNIDIKKLAEQVADLENISAKNKWTYSYDEELDSLYFSPKKIDDKFLIFTPNEEIGIYIDDKSNLGGIFIEYYKSNLTSHEEKFKPFKFIFNNKDKSTKNSRSKQIILSEVIKAELLSSLIKFKVQNVNKSI